MSNLSRVEFHSSTNKTLSKIAANQHNSHKQFPFEFSVNDLLFLGAKISANQPNNHKQTISL